MRVLLLGGTGHMMGRLLESLLARGDEVMIVSRGERALPAHTRLSWLPAERRALHAQGPALAAFAPEAVVDALCFDAADARDLASLFPQARRVVMISSVDVYGEDLSGRRMDEQSPAAPATAYARGKREAEVTLFELLGDRAAIVRPSHMLGRGFLTTSLWGRSPYLLHRLRKGLALPAIDGGRNLLTPVHSADVADCVLRCIDAPAAAGEIFNAVGGEVVTQREYYEAAARSLGVQARLVAIPSAVFARVHATPSAFNWHLIYSGEKAAALLGHQPRATLQTMMDETVRHLLIDGRVRDSAEQPIDDELVAAAEEFEKQLSQILRKKPT